MKATGRCIRLYSTKRLNIVKALKYTYSGCNSCATCKNVAYTLTSLDNF